MFNKSISIILIFNILIISFPHLNHFSDVRCKEKIKNEKILNKKGKKNKQEKISLKQSLKEIFCPLRMIVYFLWFMFVIISLVVLFIFDLVTLFQFEMLKDFIKWSENITDSLFKFFCFFCC